MSRSPAGELLRWSVLCVPFVGVVAVPWLSAAPIAVAAALLVYDGPYRRTMAGMTALLFFFEVLYAVQPGLLSLPFVLSVGCVRLLSAVVALPVLASTPAWSAGAFVRAAVLVFIVLVSISAGTVMMRAWVYGGGYAGTRFMLALSPAAMLRAWLASLLVLAVLYRIDVPFRRRTL